MNAELIECVPNFSEGRDERVIRQIADEVSALAGEGVRLLSVEPGAGANRTVITFVGPPEAVVEAAFRATRRAGELIDMRKQHGAHPRIGATDVLPLVPVRGITLEACAELARGLARRIADEAHIPCYLYEAAALRPAFRNLAVCRAGEYEALPRRMASADEAPDVGVRPWDDALARTGCTVVGARDFLVAVNFNLNTTSAELAHEIACDVRTRGRGPAQRGTLPSVKAIGWYIPEYGRAQVSTNLTDIHVTPLHVAYTEVCRAAAARGVQVTGTELIGLIPRQALVDAGRFFAAQSATTPSAAEAKRAGDSTPPSSTPAEKNLAQPSSMSEDEHLPQPSSMSEEELLATAVRAMRLDDLCPFNLSEKLL
ncbi:MAG: glutamate formimidoyltransferase [Bacteroidaceae bacterium]|nr:glutamate formimidoyltransferase [Bacteroidaceae bacterium]